MSRKLLIGIDLGTSSCKTVVFSLTGDIVGSSTKEYLTIYDNNKVEQDPNLWLKAIRYTIQDIYLNTSVEKNDIIAVAIDSQGSVVLPVDKENKPLRNAMLWTDRRSEAQCKWIKDNVGKRLYEINGNHNDPSNIAPKVLWIKENENDIYKKTFKFLHANGFLVAELTGEFSLSISDGGLTQLFDTREGTWSNKLIELHNLDIDKFPDIYECSQVVGEVLSRSAKKYNLPEGIPVMAGAMDMVASSLGSGVIERGQAYVAAGTVTALGLCLDKPIFDHDLHIYHHALPNKWISAAGVDFGGGGLRWFRDNVMKKNRSIYAYKQFENEAKETTPGSRGLIFLPFMVGQRAPIWDSDVRSVMFGINPDTTRGEIIRAIMEGNAFALRRIIEIMNNRGFVVNELRLAGGCSNVDLWNQIFADITGKKIIIPKINEVAAFGSAILAALGSGIIESEEDLLREVSILKTYYPRQEYSKRYSDMYTLFKNLFNHIREDYHRLGNIKNMYF